ncbi:MAG: cytochrome c [Terrimonas ferruginea]|uniref:c-type cytochrome n=1 Tax=Terrimonas ferruginea TaxID=249 RepID=UPI001AC2A771|nr:cytochrome c [Terrimonas ferruginea]MBN8783019.1 cytochrome c [Terrimonas ferruginea]
MRAIFAILSLYVVVFCFSSCRQAAKMSPKPFSPSILREQVFQIDPSMDTTIITAHGARVKIPSDAFAGGGKIAITIREAFTSAEILAAGLTTESNGRPLRSGGMIYINATAGGEMTTLVKPLGVSMPYSYYDSTMKVFKGVETDSGTVNWVEPDTLNPPPQDLQLGSILYHSKCATCHGSDVKESAIGPSLVNVDQRWPKTKLYEWIRNNRKLIESGYPRAVEMSKYSPTSMDLFPVLDNQSIDAIIQYVNNQSKYPSLMPQQPVPTSGKDTSSGSFTAVCKEDTIYVKPSLAETSQFTDDIPTVPATPPAQNANTFSGEKELDDPEERNVAFTDGQTSGMYEFQIKTFGWYNIDAYMEGYAGTQPVKVWARLQGTFDMDINVYLFCPDKQILSVSNGKDEKGYYFDKTNGGVPLFLRDRAVLFAFGRKGEKIVYGVSEFSISLEQVISVIVKDAPEQELLDALKNKNINGIDLGLEKLEMRIVPGDCGERALADTSSK